MENESPGGTVVAGFTHIDTIGNNTFLNNIGTAFQVIVWVDGWMEEQIVGRMKKWTNIKMDGWRH